MKLDLTLLYETLRQNFPHLSEIEIQQQITKVLLKMLSAQPATESNQSIDPPEAD